MTFNHIRFKKPLPLKRVMKEGKRWYQITPTKEYQSVTTVLGSIDVEGLNKWKDEVGEKMAGYISGKATSIGTEMHTIIEEYLNNTPLDEIESKHKKLLPKAHFYNIRHFIDHIDNIWGTEIGLYSDKLRLAGTTDCIAEFDGVPSIIDFKTSGKEKKEEWIEKYYLQATCYSQMFFERANIDIDQIVIIISGEDGSAHAYTSSTIKHLNRLNEVLETYNANNKM